MFGNLLRESGVAERLGRAANVAGVIGTAVAAGVFLAQLG